MRPPDVKKPLDAGGAGAPGETTEAGNLEAQDSTCSKNEQPRYGAMLEDWSNLDLGLGLTQDLLPVVSNPTATIAPKSTMQSLGKTPSVYNRDHHVVGMRGWTERIATGEEIGRWSQEPDYGICLQTRTVRALDVDVDDRGAADKVRQFIQASVGELPERYRGNSGKFLQAFRMPGEFGKRRIVTATGIIEFLGNGQQCVAHGTHPSGARYEWTWPDDCYDFPTLSVEAFEALWKALQATFGVEPGVVSTPTASRAQTLREAAANDPLARYLFDKGWVKSQKGDGGLFVVCPWEEEHSSDTGESATIYWPAHTNGHEHGGFKCLHAHCDGRKLPDFIEVVGYQAPGILDGMDGMDGGGVLRPLKDVAPEAIDWVWSGWLARGMLHILAGRPGTGKTNLALQAAATLSAGGTWPDGTKSRPGRVIIWSGEDDLSRVIVPRLRAMGANLERIEEVADVPGRDGKARPFDPATDMPVLAAALRRSGGADLLIIDSVVSAVAGDSHKNAEVRRGLQPVIDLAQEFGCAVLGISHYTKGTEGRDPVERVSGSIAYGALARMVWVAAPMAEDKGGGSMLARAKSNIGPNGGGFQYSLEVVQLPDFEGIEATRVVWGAQLEGSAHALLAEAEGSSKGAPRTVRDEAKFWLTLALDEGPRPAAEIRDLARAEGFTPITLRRAREDLGVKAFRAGGVAGGGWWVWALPGLENLE